MSQRALIESVASRYGLDAVPGSPTSQSADGIMSRAKANRFVQLFAV